MSDLSSQPDNAADATDLAHGMRRGLESDSGMQRLTKKLEQVDTLSRQNDLLSGALAHLMKSYGLTTLRIGSFELENGPRVKAWPDSADTPEKLYNFEIR